MTDLYNAADHPAHDAISSKPPKWITVQKLAFSTTLEDEQELESMVQMASQETVRLPILRKVIADAKLPFGNVVKGQMVLLDLVSSPNDKQLAPITYMTFTEQGNSRRRGSGKSRRDQIPHFTT